jgi:hypothetical protein
LIASQVEGVLEDRAVLAAAFGELSLGFLFGLGLGLGLGLDFGFLRRAAIICLQCSSVLVPLVIPFIFSLQSSTTLFTIAAKEAAKPGSTPSETKANWTGFCFTLVNLEASSEHNSVCFLPNSLRLKVSLGGPWGQ